jgi:hypothetical protein
VKSTSLVRNRAPFVLAAAAVIFGGAAGLARAQESRFVVVDLSEGTRNEKVAATIEKEVSRLRPGARPIDDAVMRRLLATGEGPAAAATRLTKEAEQRRAAGDCAAAADRARQAEAATLSAVSLDDERDMLRSQYTILVICEHQRGRAAERDVAARRLRALVSLPPPGLPAELWENHVAKATAGPATTELHVDSEPANAQISIDFHGEGVTPRTLKVPKGTIYVEVQKDGYRKGFRKLEVGTEPVRAAFRLIERTHDRMDQALNTLTVLRSSDPTQRPSVLSRLAQLARAETLVGYSLSGNRVKIWFFDAEKGALAKEIIESEVDLATGNVPALAARPTPGGAKPGATGGVPSTTAPPAGGPPATSTGGGGIFTSTPKDSGKPPGAEIPPSGTGRSSLPEAQTQAQEQLTAAQIIKRRRGSAPWWSWAIAGAIGASLLAYIYLDRPERKDTLAVRVFWTPPSNTRP